MEIKRWFDYATTELALQHKEACERSIKKQCCIKVFSGYYYYKGYSISRSGTKPYEWNWKTLGDVYTMPEYTKAACIEAIDMMLNRSNYYAEVTI